MRPLAQRAPAALWPQVSPLWRAGAPSRALASLVAAASTGSPLSSSPQPARLLTTMLLMLYITVVPMGITNVAWFSVVGLLPAHVAGLSAIAVPMVAMFTGALVHQDPLGVVQLSAMGAAPGRWR